MWRCDGLVRVLGSQLGAIIQRRNMAPGEVIAKWGECEKPSFRHHVRALGAPLTLTFTRTLTLTLTLTRSHTGCAMTLGPKLAQ